MRKLALVLLAAAPLAAGCVTAPPTAAVEPSVCVGSFSGAGGSLSASLASVSNPAGLRSLRVLTRDAFSAQGCDLILAAREGLIESGQGADHHLRQTGRPADCGITAYSAHTRKEVGTIIRNSPGCEDLQKNLRTLIQPGASWHAGIGSGVQSPTLEQVEALTGGRVLTRAELAARASAPALPVAAVPAVPAPAVVEPSSDVDAPPAQGPVGRGHAVVIGIERYRETLPRADFAARDARVTAAYAKRVLGYPEANVAVLLDDRATRGDFEKYFERWLPNRVEKDDEVFVYFSGHGAPDLKTGDGYLVPYDGDPTYIEQTGYSLKRMYEALAKLPAKKVTVALDSCFSGAGGRSVIAKGARPLVAVTQSAVPAGLTVLSASAGDQTSNSLQSQGHGLFTYFFLKGLKEKGADFKAVFDYLKPEVAKVARREYNADQDPQWREGN